MDESSLLDLLECSVCLERLDTTAKVLPCQHTFCRRCLESIVSSRHELRCPECRILVGCGVDELPANILLVRLLDGIRQRPRAAGGASGSPSAAAPAYPQPAAAPSAVAAAAASAAASLRELAAASRSALLGKVGAGRAERAGGQSTAEGCGVAGGERGAESRRRFQPRCPAGAGAAGWRCPPGSVGLRVRCAVC